MRKGQPKFVEIQDWEEFTPGGSVIIKYISEWVHYKINYRAGSQEHYELIAFKEGVSSEEKKKRIKEAGEDWAERRLGKYVDFTIKVDIVSHPSEEWIKSKIEGYELKKKDVNKDLAKYNMMLKALSKGKKDEKNMVPKDKARSKKKKSGRHKNNH